VFFSRWIRIKRERLGEGLIKWQEGRREISSTYFLEKKGSANEFGMMKKESGGERVLRRIINRTEEGQLGKKKGENGIFPVREEKKTTSQQTICKKKKQRGREAHAH